MAEGRMLSRKIGRDPRIAALSLKARILWMVCISVQEHGGILPRDAHELRMDACPDWADITDKDMESAILEWFILKPAIVEEVETKNGIKKLRFIEFYICNENLQANAFRQRKFRLSHKVTLRNVTNGSNERSEVKGSEVKNNKQHICSFDRFWEAYPRKEGRKPALERWLKLRLEAKDVDIILKAVVKQKGSAQWRQGIIPHAVTWLNQERWTDEQETNNNDPIYA